MNDLFFYKDIEFYHKMIKNDQHFKYSRYNDGELIAIIGKTPMGANCDGHQYFPEMSVELKNALLNYKNTNDYILESFNYWYMISQEIRDILHSLKSMNPELTFLDTDFIRIPHEQNPSQFIDLFNTIKTKKVVIIGPEYLKKLNRFFEFKHIIIPLKNCYKSKDDIIRQIKEINNVEENNYYLFSASMATKVIIEEFKFDKKNTYIDWGSVWDTFFVSPEYNFIRKRSTSDHDKYKIIYKDYLI